MRASADNVDFLIIGGGIAGCTLARALAVEGHAVTIVERACCGQATSAVNQGGVRQQFFQEHNILAGRETVRQLEEMPETWGLDPDFRQNGYLLLLSKEASVAAFEKAVTAQARARVPSRMVSALDASKILPDLRTDGIIAASFCPTDGVCDPVKTTQAYLQLASQAGARILEQTDVIAFIAGDSRIDRVQTTAGSIAVGSVVNAAGPWARQVARLLGGDLPIHAHQSSIFLFDPGHARNREMPMVIDIDDRVTLCPHENGIMVGDARKPRVEHPGLGAACDWSTLPIVRGRAASRLPELSDASVARAWAGYWEVTPDDDPVIDSHLRENFFVFAGFSGHGMSIIPGLAPSVAQALTGQSTDIDLKAFGLARFSGQRARQTEIWGGTAVLEAEMESARVHGGAETTRLQQR